MKKVIFGVGVVGSGKTTVLKKFADDYNYLYVSPDDIRKELTGNEIDQTRNAEVWVEAYKRAKEGLDNGQTIVFDATFTKKEDRWKLIDFVRENGAEKVQAVYIDTPLEISKERNLNRERQVPEYVLDRMAGQLRKDPPRLEDDLDGVFTLDEYGDLIKAETTFEKRDIEKRFEPKIL